MRWLLLLLPLAPVRMQAQHCSFDFANIIVVRPHAHGDTTLIEGLRIVLLDKDNLPATSTGTPFYLFHRNTDRPMQWMHPFTWRGTADGNSPSHRTTTSCGPEPLPHGELPRARAR